METIIRIAFAVVIGVVVTVVLENYTHLIHSLDVLLGVLAFFLVYWQAPHIFNR